MAFPLINPYQQFIDSSGDPLVSGTIEFRDPVTDSLINSYPTADDADAQTNANDNPLTLSATGAATTGLYLEDGVAYKVVLKDLNGDTVTTQDDVRCPIALPYLETAAETAAAVTPTDVAYPPGDVRRYGAVGDGSTDDYQAFTDALSIDQDVFAPLTTAGYKIGTTLTNISAYQRLDIYADVKYSGAASTALFEINGTAHCEVTCHQTVTGDDDNYCTHWKTGTSNKFVFNKTVGFLIHHFFEQQVGGFAASHTLVENQIWYTLMSGFNAAEGASITGGQGVLFRNTTGDTGIAMEGLELHGGFIWRHNGHGIHIENNVDALYMVVYGAIDNLSGGGQDYTVDAGSQQTSAVFFVKFLRQAASTFGDGDMYFNPRNGQLFINALTLSAAALDITSQTGDTLSVPAGKLIAAMKGGVTEATKYYSVVAGTDEALSSSEDIFVAGYYDPGTTTPPAAADAKEAGMSVAFRRNDDASAIEGGTAAFKKRAALNKTDMVVSVHNGTSLTDTFMVRSEGGIGVNNAVANVNTPSGATSEALPIYDETGTLIGYIPIYASQW